MSFLFPGFLLAAGAISACAVLLHFIVTREPDQLELPTARFAPERTIQARVRRFEPKDLLLLAIRVSLVLSAGAALAGPLISPPRRALARIVVLDRSRAVASGREAADSARALLGTGDVLIVFDSSATVVERAVSDTLAGLTPSVRPGRLSTALIAALRAASRIRNRADSIELAIVSPLVREEIDAATDSLRALWPAGIRLVSVSPRSDSAGLPPVTLESSAGDPLALALPPASGRIGTGTVRVVRRLATAADSVWAGGADRVLVVWPASRAVPAGWASRTPDTAGAVAAGGAVVVAPLVRTLEYRDGARQVVARWVDGEPAAVEEAFNAGCIRTVTIEVPVIGDLVLDPRFRRLVSELLERCGGGRDFRSLDPAHRLRMAGSSGGFRADAAGLAAPEQMGSPVTKWLLIGALLLAALETFVRRRAAA